MGQSKQMRILIYRPEKADNPNIRQDCLYYPNGNKYSRPTPKQPEHPLEKLNKIKITNSMIEVAPQ